MTSFAENQLKPDATCAARLLGDYVSEDAPLMYQEDFVTAREKVPAADRPANANQAGEETENEALQHHRAAAWSGCRSRDGSLSGG
jgi:hypothetical protein